MASKTQVIIIITLIGIASTMAILGSATDNQEVINRLCGATFAPEACKKCINDPVDHGSGPIQNEVDVLLALLNCADDDDTKIEADFFKIFNSEQIYSMSQETVTALKDCNYLLGIVTERNGIIIADIERRHWADAKSHIDTEISGRLRDCDKALGRPNVTVPPVIFADNLAVEANYKMIYQILSVL